MDLEKKAIERIQLASEISLHHYGKPLVCTYSGGKDSDVMLELFRMGGIPFEVHNSHTTAYDIQKVLDELERKIEFAGKMMVEKPSDKLDEIANNAAEDFILAYSEAIEIVKRGGRDEK